MAALFWVAAAFAYATPPVPPALPSYEGKPISRIEFVPPDQPLSLANLAAILPVHAGQPLQGEDVRAAIQRLYATGEYADIAVDATLQNEGLVLRFMTKPNLFIGRVTTEGVSSRPSSGQLVAASKLDLGAEFARNDVTQATENIGDVLRRNGFYSASIVPNLARDVLRQSVDVNFEIVPGKRAKFDGLELTGDPQRSATSILSSTGWRRPFGFLGWREFTENRVQSGLDNIRGWYEKHDHLLATVRLAKLDFHAAANTVTPVVDVQAGPAVNVNVSGAKISEGRLRHLLPIYQERAVDKDLLMEGRRDLTQYLQARGYFDADVSFEVDRQKTGEEWIDYNIDPGIRHRLVAIKIDGNKYFDTPTLRERMYLMHATLRYRRGRFSEDYLAKDLNSLRDLYRANGFRDVAITSEQIDDYQGKTGDIGVLIHIDEGPQYFVSKLELAGVPEEDRAPLRRVLTSTEGQSYSDLNVASDRDNVLDYFFNNGYSRTTFEFSATPASEPFHVDLRFEVRPGPRQFVRDVLVTGLETTRPDLVGERISVRPGQPLSRSRMLESQRRLYDLDIFAKVNTALQNPEGTEPTKRVLYSLDEARRYSLNIGFGAELGRIGGGTTDLNTPQGATGFSPRISLGVSRLNFLGLGHTVSLQGRVSTLQQRALFTYQIPQFTGDPNLSLTFSGLFDTSKDVRTFSDRREEGSIQLARKYTKAVTIQYRYTFRRVNIIGTPLVSPELIPLIQRPERVGALSTTFIQDRRDDPTDAHRGIYNTLDVAMATRALGSNTGFGRVLARNATYHRLTRNLVFAREILFGTIDRFSGLQDIPVPEKFFSGGTSSLRAFPDNQAGPRDLQTGFPIGGNALLLNTLELRFPLLGDNIGGVLFNDMGNVYSDIGNISLRFRQRNLQDFDYGVQAFGFGIRYRTPIGPVRVDLSVSPNPPRFFGYKGTEQQLLFGTGQQVTQRINIFQFHFSLGQAF